MVRNYQRNNMNVIQNNMYSICFLGDLLSFCANLNLFFCRFNTIVIVQLLSCVQRFVTQWTIACQDPLSSTISQSLLKFMSIESVMLSDHLSSSATLFSSCLQSIQALMSFPVSWPFTSTGKSIGVSDLASVLPMNILG